ncbi:hypothetical protein BPAE_0165g00090 [Botrytis paeoniae]|uniref:Uncharacterized protein n=1 Tax=Botrytis paeoniae TaxID=278948 RepID=A0A4Z1FIR9_9HELO|nr:hypothetical protein BPAE_0165g00090 [Botrytis paeoniae]
MPIHRSYSQWLLAIKNRVIRPNPPDGPLDTRGEWNSLVDRLRKIFDLPFNKEIRDYVLVSAIWNYYFGLDTIRNAPLFISRPSYCDLDWLMPSTQVLQSDHESHIQPPVLPPQPEEQDHTPEPQPQPQGTTNEPSQPSQPQFIHEAQSLPLSIELGLSEETKAVDPSSNLNNTPVVRCLIYTRNHPTGDNRGPCTWHRCRNNHHSPCCPFQRLLWTN